MISVSSTVHPSRDNASCPTSTRKNRSSAQTFSPLESWRTKPPLPISGPTGSTQIPVLRLGQTVVADSVNPLAITRDAWRKTAASASVAIFEVEVICSNADEHRRRLEARRDDTPPVTWAQVVENRYEAWDRPDLILIALVACQPRCSQNCGLGSTGKSKPAAAFESRMAVFRRPRVPSSRVKLGTANPSRRS